MSETLALVLLALLQGFTEFLPISSSGHLLLAEQGLGLAGQGLVMEVAVHMGTLAAVLWYFRRECWGMGLSVLDFRNEQRQSDRRLFCLLCLATIPVCVVGLLAHDWIASALQQTVVMGWATLLFGIVLGVADRMGHRQRTMDQLGWRDALLIGFAQVLALIPGTSRSGITLTAGLFAGLGREAAARFSFLLSIPTIIAAGALESIKLFGGEEAVAWGGLLLAATISAVIAVLTIHFFLRWLERIGLMPFVIYRVILGALILVLFV